jgi:hypothetical protein
MRARIVSSTIVDDLERQLGAFARSYNLIDASWTKPGIRREFVVPRGNPTILFDSIEEPFDQVTRLVEMRAEAGRLAADRVSVICWPSAL